MKKKLALAITTALTAGMMFGTCASAESESIELTVSWWGNQVRNERTQEALDLYTEQNPDVTFDGQFSEWSDYWNKLATAAAGHSMPDIVQMDYKYIQQYVNNGLLVDLTPYVESGVIDVSNSNEGVIYSAQIDDGLYAICAGVNAPALLYNKTILDEAGITVEDNMTLEEFKELSKQIYEATGYKTNMKYYGDEDFLEYLLRADDIVMMGDDSLGGTAEDYIEYFKLYEDGLAEGWVVDAAVFAERTIGTPEQDAVVYGSDPSMMSWCSFSYTNQLTAFRNAAPEGTEIAMTTWPSDDPAKSNYLKPSQFFSISTDSANPDAAAEVLGFITNSVDCNNILLGERGVPVDSTVADAISENLDETSQEVIQFINEVVSPNSSQINPPQPDGASEVRELLNSLEEKVCYGEMTAEEAGTQFFTEGSEILASSAAE